ncbi:ComF family protein [Altererythrobacter sp. ZODW24]|uniref:ComF family protein n=1 Tax=Altererythrobacter sp. ZODW24 TaxID=2185142 RepID=UPI000DF852B1|nr:ComF family protein [Altererythrobacter sp. ZODW24]
MSLSEAVAPVVDLIYPPRCPLCGDGLAAQTGLCSDCWSQLVIPGNPACDSCQRPFADGIGQDQAICGPCLADPPVHDGIAAGTLYNDPSRKLILSFKHGRRIALAPMLARLMAARLPDLEGEWLIIPVPLHRWRIWKRGFNQAAMLATEIGKLKGAAVCLDGLVRLKKTPSLGGLGKKARAKALAGAIGVNPRRRESLSGRQVILVDDVMTSGATSNACVKALKKAGASKVIVACFARVTDQV